MEYMGESKDLTSGETNMSKCPSLYTKDTAVEFHYLFLLASPATKLHSPVSGPQLMRKTPVTLQAITIMPICSSIWYGEFLTPQFCKNISHSYTQLDSSSWQMVLLAEVAPAIPRRAVQRRGAWVGSPISKVPMPLTRSWLPPYFIRC
jgi:hypothetical protein